MPGFVPFFIVLIAALFFSSLFNRLHLPWVVALILGGILIGPSALNILEIDGTIEFMGQIGLIFVMFMAGLETKFSTIRQTYKNIAGLSFINALIPALAGFFIAFYFEYSITASLLIGLIFMSSSVAVVIPALESTKVIKTKLGQSLVTATMIEDVTSLMLLSILLQKTNPLANIPLPIFYVLLLFILFLLRWTILKLKKYYSSKLEDRFESEFRLVLAVLIGTVLIFELLGLHPIIAGFFAGFVLADSISTMRGAVLREKLHAISYGLFIPIFFLIVGYKTDIEVFSQTGPAIKITLFIIIGSILSKFFSGFLGAKISGFNNSESLFAGSATIPQLSTTLAVAFTGLEFNIIDEKMITALVLLSITTTFLSPILVQLLSKKVRYSNTSLIEL